MLVTFLSRDLGLIRAKAISSRKAEAKLKGHIVPYTLGTYGFVRGKNGWRLVHADASENIFFSLGEIPLSLARRTLMGRVLSLVGRVSEEQKNHELFECITSGLKFLKVADEENLKAYEIIFVGRVMALLGYVSFDDMPEPFKEWKTFSRGLIESSLPHTKMILSRINEGLKESHL